jgi:hypothetical protein
MIGADGSSPTVAVETGRTVSTTSVVAAVVAVAGRMAIVESKPELPLVPWMHAPSKVLIDSSNKMTTNNFLRCMIRFYSRLNKTGSAATSKARSLYI